MDLRVYGHNIFYFGCTFIANGDNVCSRVLAFLVRGTFSREEVDFIRNVDLPQLIIFLTTNYYNITLYSTAISIYSPGVYTPIFYTVRQDVIPSVFSNSLFA